MKSYVGPSVVIGIVLVLGAAAISLPLLPSRSTVQAEPEREPFHGSFVCEFYGAKTQQITDVVDYDVFDVGNNFGWHLTLADGAQMMYLQSADKFCYTVANKPKA